MFLQIRTGNEHTSKSSLSKTDQHVVIGKVVSTFGLKGMIKVWPLTDFPERFNAGKIIYIQQKPLHIEDCIWHKRQVRLKLKEIRKIEDAKNLVGYDISVPANDLPKLDDKEYFVSELIGIEAFDDNGKYIGKVEEVIFAPAHDLYKINSLYVPAVKEFIKEIDTKNKRMIVHIIPGLEDL